MRRAALPFLYLLFLAACVPESRPGESGPPRPQKPAPTPPSRPPLLRPSAFPHVARPVPPPPPAGAAHLDPPIEKTFADSFDRAGLGAAWAATGNMWRIQAGRLCVEHAKNHPAWLRRRLPRNAQIEFDASTASADGDIKAEFWGDGKSAAETVSYTAATSYITIFGGWKNSYHVLARIDEHAQGRPEIRLTAEADDVRARHVEPNRTYHFKVVRDDGKTVRWLVDDIELLSFADPSPLSGPGHDHFGFNNWDVPLCFDNLTITPLP